MNETPFLSYPAALREALAVHEAFRKLGFTPEQIYMHRNPKPHRDIVVVVIHLERQFAVTCGGQELNRKWKERWRELVERYNRGDFSEDEFQAWYDRSFVGTRHVELLLGLAQKGIAPPLGKD